MQKLKFERLGIKKTIKPTGNVIKACDVEPINEEETILEYVKILTGMLRNRLKKEDCNELVTIHISQNMEIVRFDINKETYVRFDEWKKL